MARKLFDHSIASGRKVWLDFFPYTAKMLGQANEDLWMDPISFLSVFSQGQSLLKSDVLSINISGFYSLLLNRTSNVSKILEAKKPAAVLKKLLALEEPKSVLAEIMTGLQNLYGGKQPLVLALPSPQKWLQWLNTLIGSSFGMDFSEDDVDTAAMYLAEYLRSFSSWELSAIVLEEGDSPFFKFQLAAELYQPVFNLAHHYQWLVGIRTCEPLGDIAALPEAVDFYLCGQSSMINLIPLWEKELHFYGGLNDDFWLGRTVLPSLPTFGIAFGTIPVQSEPEMVLTRLKMIR